MEKKTKKFRARLTFTAVFQGENAADAVYDISYLLRHQLKDVRNPTISIIGEERPENEQKAIAEAPYADQLQPVNEEAAPAIQLVPGLTPGTEPGTEAELQNQVNAATSAADDFPF